ncbi:MAG: basic amino acid ABC transporter substrate-binding protein [Armatimonadota bacterium]|nr:basic amino acid ABC transporter substrate-binding protein [Armatimonadota bacterium]MDR7536535.1 basic amino acid ABC transporter substrate-binding protein [Armatimonadota bacterium]
MKGRFGPYLAVLAVVVVLGLYYRARQQPAPPPAPVQQEPAPTAAPTAALPDLGGRELKIGSDTTYPPFEYVDENKNIVGFDPDLLAEICRRVNCRASFVTTAWEGIFVALAQGQFDAVASGVTITEERRKTVDFSEPYLTYGQVVLVRQDEAFIKGVDTLVGKTVAVQTGTTNDEKALALQKEGKLGSVRRYETFALAVQALINRDVDAVIIDSYAADGFIALHAGQLKKVGEPFTSEALGIAIKKGDAVLKEALDAALIQMKADGTLERLYQKWFVERAPGKQ